MVIIGTIIYTIGAIVSRIPSSKIPIHLQFFTNIITFIIVIIAYNLAPQLFILEESNKCNLVNKKDMHKTYLSKNLNSLFFADPIILKEISKNF